METKKTIIFSGVSIGASTAIVDRAEGKILAEPQRRKVKMVGWRVWHGG
jgi:hypothetical protein